MTFLNSCYDCSTTSIYCQVINTSMTYFTRLPQLNVETYTNYFLNTFVPKIKFQSLYFNCTRKEFCTDPNVMSLDRTLQEKYNLPPIDYFMIFKHTKSQSIHHDGKVIPRYASLNLPLTGFESTKMIFYKTIDKPYIVSDANYYYPKNLEPVIELEGSNEWVLVDSSVPHHITNVNFNNPRITLCLRFKGNPTLEHLLSNIWSGVRELNPY